MIVAELPPGIAGAVEHLAATFGSRLTVEASDPSGATIRISGVELGEGWSAPTADLWCLIPFHYPDAAIYPYYATGAIPTRAVPALQPVTWRGMASIQVSLRHNAWDPARDTAVGSVLQTLAWLRAL